MGTFDDEPDSRPNDCPRESSPSSRSDDSCHRRSLSRSHSDESSRRSKRRRLESHPDDGRYRNSEESFRLSKENRRGETRRYRRSRSHSRRRSRHWLIPSDSLSDSLSDSRGRKSRYRCRSRRKESSEWESRNNCRIKRDISTDRCSRHRSIEHTRRQVGESKTLLKSNSHSSLSQKPSIMKKSIGCTEENQEELQRRINAEVAIRVEKEVNKKVEEILGTENFKREVETRLQTEKAKLEQTLRQELELEKARLLESFKQQEIEEKLQSQKLEDILASNERKVQEEQRRLAGEQARRNEERLQELQRIAQQVGKWDLSSDNVHSEFPVLGFI